MSPAPFVHRIRVRYGECDAQAVVFNPHYLAYADLAIGELFREAFGPWTAVLDAGVDLVAAHAELTWTAPARYDDLLDLEVAVVHLGTTSMQTRIRILRAEHEAERCCEIAMRHVFIDPGTKQKTPIPDAIRAGLQRFAA